MFNIKHVKNSIFNKLIEKRRGNFNMTFQNTNSFKAEINDLVEAQKKLLGTLLKIYLTFFNF